MTLNELYENFYSRPFPKIPPSKIYVFDSEDAAENWIECRYSECDIAYNELSFVLQSARSTNVFLIEKWREAEVEHFYAVEPDVLVAVVNPSNKKSEGEG